MRVDVLCRTSINSILMSRYLIYHFINQNPKYFFPADGLKTVKLGLNKMECGFLARLHSVQDVHPNEQVLDLSFYESIL